MKGFKIVLIIFVILIVVIMGIITTPPAEPILPVPIEGMPHKTLV